MLEHTVGKATRPVTYFSVFLRVFTCSRYSHLSIDYNNEHGERRVLEAVLPMVQDVPYDEWFNRSDRRVLPMEVDTSYYKTDLSAARQMVGKRYGMRDLSQIFLNVVRTFWFCFGRTWNQRDGGCENTVYCTEMGTVLLGIYEEGIKLPGHFEFLRGLLPGKEFITKRQKK